jgi:hypothetical protein
MFETLGNLGDFLGGIGVVVTLVYLALQIRQNTRATRAASFHAVTDARNRVNVSISESAEMARIFMVGSEDRSALSPEDRVRFDLTCLSYLHVVESMHYQAMVGAGEKGLVDAEARSLASLLSDPGVRDWWYENPHAFGPRAGDHQTRGRLAAVRRGARREASSSAQRVEASE